MTTNMITAARLLGHKTVNGRYQSLLALDDFPVLGHQMVRFSGVTPALLLSFWVPRLTVLCTADALGRHLHY